MHQRAFTLALAAVFVMAQMAAAGTRSCTSSMVSLNICRSTADVAYCLAIGTVDPDGAGPLLPPTTTIADAFASTYNWQSPAPCSQDMVAAGICTQPQIGTQVAITKAQFADLQVRIFIRDVMRRYLRQRSMNEAAAASDLLADPDLGQ